MAAHKVTTIDPKDRESFTHLKEAWWDRKGAMRPLHHLNPERVKFIVEHSRQHCNLKTDAAAAQEAVNGYYARLEALEKSGNQEGAKAHAPTPTSQRLIDGMTVLDVGCGGGILAEPMAYLGATVTGIDSVGEGLPVARSHAESMGVKVNYLQTTVEDLAATGQQFDIVMVMEVIEHVANVPEFVDACSRLVKPGGFFVLSTPNRNILSYLAVIVAAEWILGWIPIGMHQWSKFLKPAELEVHLRRSGLVPQRRCGFVFDPLFWRWHIKNIDWIDYIVTCVKPDA